MPKTAVKDPFKHITYQDKAAAEAMAAAKTANRKLAKQESRGMAERIAVMDGHNVNTAVQMLQEVSQHERELYLTAEKLSKKRSTILGHFGW